MLTKEYIREHLRGFKIKVGTIENPARKIIVDKLIELGFTIKRTYKQKEWLVYARWCDELRYADTSIDLVQANYVELKMSDFELIGHTITADEFAKMEFEAVVNEKPSSYQSYQKGEVLMSFDKRDGNWTMWDKGDVIFYGEIPHIEALKYLLWLQGSVW